MRLLKFFSLFPLALSAIIFAEAEPKIEYVKIRLRPTKYNINVHPVLCESKTFIGEDVDVSRIIPSLAGTKINVWEGIQFVGALLYGTGTRGRDLEPLIDFLSPPMQGVAKFLLGSFDFLEFASNVDNSKERDNPPLGVDSELSRSREKEEQLVDNDQSAETMQSIITLVERNVQNPQAPVTSVIKYGIWYYTVQTGMIGISLGYQEGFHSFETVRSAIFISAHKFLENAVVEYVGNRCNLQPDGKMRLRAGFKAGSLAVAVLLRKQLGWLTYIDSEPDDVPNQGLSLPAEASILATCHICNNTLIAQIEAQNGTLKDILELKEEQKKDQSRRAVIQEETEEDQLFLAKLKKKLAEGDQEELVSIDPKSHSDLANAAQKSGSAIPPAPTLSSGPPVHAGGRAALFDDIKKDNKKRLNPVEQDETQRKKSDEQQLFENAADLMRQKMAERRNSSGYAENDRSSFPHSEPTDRGNQDW